ncbi:MAG: 2'-5' RNA ligase family protein [Armatimonadota bacterium]|nr:MAG: 2'-5' RNA ligase family protein [Armatimonadota bacterium]
MVTTYAADISHWEAWQPKWRFGVILIYPPDPPLLQVNALRAKYDPRSQSTCDGHISLTVPLPRVLTESHWDELWSIASGIAPFTIDYGPLMNYLPHPGVCLAIEPQAELDSLRAALETASAFAGAPPRRYPFSAHMTIAEFISADETKALMVELKDVAPQGSFSCTCVSYAVPDGNFRFAERRRLELSC